MRSNQLQKVWTRWLHTECLVPLEHVAAVLELDVADVAGLRRPCAP